MTFKFHKKLLGAPVGGYWVYGGNRRLGRVHRCVVGGWFAESDFGMLPEHHRRRRDAALALQQFWEKGVTR